MVYPLRGWSTLFALHYQQYSALWHHRWRERSPHLHAMHCTLTPQPLYPRAWTPVCLLHGIRTWTQFLRLRSVDVVRPEASPFASRALLCALTQLCRPSCPKQPLISTPRWYYPPSLPPTLFPLFPGTCQTIREEHGCRSTRRTASTARRATSRTRART